MPSSHYLSWGTHTPMHPFLVALNAFWEDSSVLVVVAYLFTRGRLLAFFFPQGSDEAGRPSRFQVIVSGVTFGAVGATEYLFPNLRYPYATQTLFITFATFSCGAPVGAIAAAVVLLGALIAGTTPVVLGTITAAAVASLIAGQGMRRINGMSHSRALVGWPVDLGAENTRALSTALVAGMLSQAIALALHWLIANALHFPAAYSSRQTYALISIPANGIGMALLELIVREAWQRTEADRLRREAEAARAFAAQQQLAALRARVHPHFLFNTLNSIAALCTIAPDRAEAATVQLGEVMRRALNAAPQTLTGIDNEIADARAYIEIESYRYDDRLRVEWRIAPGVDAARIPPFTLSTLLDNAVNHGIASRNNGGNIVVSLKLMKIGTIRQNDKKIASGRILVAVQDNGVGMSPEARHAAVRVGKRPHGLQLLDEQLRLIFGPHARLRIFSRPGLGTLVVFAAPLELRRETLLARTSSAGSRQTTP